MPPRSKVSQLPEDLRAELTRRLVANGFSDYEALAAWLTAAGYAIGKSAVHGFGQDLQRQLARVRASTEAARLVSEAAGDEADERSGAVIAMIQTEIFDALVSLQEAEETDDKADRLKLLNAAAKNVATLTRASVSLKRFQSEVAARVKAAADAVEKVASGGGLTPEALARIREEIYGIVK